MVCKEIITIPISYSDTGETVFHEVHIGNILYFRRYNELHWDWEAQIEGIGTIVLLQDAFECFINTIKEMAHSVIVIDPDNPTKNYFPNNKLN